ncbi:ATP synthase F1 subunit gamma [Candidatus Uhrbacteria bacterium]|jgi:F-type H+-transporting ATPase subunit gamma|nr:ATP synthase F1 subunit gamma [Candidatus Uhrbacteria bacterium]
MAANAKVVKRRIKSIANTMKITKAMELVAASKMRRAIQSVLGTRPYAQLAWQTVNAISRATGETTHPLLEEKPDATKTLLILFTADRGLAGGYNVNMIKTAIKAVKAIDDSEVEAISVGKRGTAALARNEVPVIATFEDLSKKPVFEDILPIGNMVIEAFIRGDYKRVVVGYTDFISGLTQKPRTFELLPLGQPDDALGDVSRGKDEAIEVKEASEYKFEPNPQEVLNRILGRLVETMLYQALLESTASEHSARMMAMRNATDSAKDMLGELKFAYNRLRQASITQEIAEISSGKAALE